VLVSVCVGLSGRVADDPSSEGLRVPAVIALMRGEKGNNTTGDKFVRLHTSVRDSGLVSSLTLPFHPPTMRLCVVAALLVAPLGASAQLFEHFFQSHSSPPPPSGVEQYRNLYSSSQSRFILFVRGTRLFSDPDEITAGCDAYLCPMTLECVSSPSACSCPFEQDIKCPTSGSNFVCLRGVSDCSSVASALSL
jgi:hypothetical protein